MESGISLLLGAGGARGELLAPAAAGAEPGRAGAVRQIRSRHRPGGGGGRRDPPAAGTGRQPGARAQRRPELERSGTGVGSAGQRPRAAAPRGPALPRLGRGRLRSAATRPRPPTWAHRSRSPRLGAARPAATPRPASPPRPPTAWLCSTAPPPPRRTSAWAWPTPPATTAPATASPAPATGSPSRPPTAGKRHITLAGHGRRCNAADCASGTPPTRGVINAGSISTVAGPSVVHVRDYAARKSSTDTAA